MSNSDRYGVVDVIHHAGARSSESRTLSGFFDAYFSTRTDIRFA
jgi:hypothetical protein